MDRTRLLVKNLPDNIPDFNDYFRNNYGAIQTKKYGRRRAIIKFQDENLAREALYRLHQSELGNRILSVEYIGANHNISEEADDKETNKKPPVESKLEIPDFVKKLYATNSKLGFDQPPPPYLKYYYPKINRNILDSISIALLSVPKFYTQVLHLMNRMNLDPPFLPLRKPFVPPGELCDAQTQTDLILDKNSLHKRSSKLLASDESELETDDEDSENMKDTIKLKQIRKRKISAIDDSDFMKIKAKKLLQNTRLIESKQINIEHHKAKNLNEIFEKNENERKVQKIELNVTNLKLPEKIESSERKEQKDVENNDDKEKINESKKTKYISDEDMKHNRISENQLKELPFFKNYQKGEKSNKLYIKNLSKDVTEDDLKMIYGRFASNSESISDEIHVKLMQFGKMKGQAFITFITLKSNDNFDIVEKALNETNGFILKNKPMIVCFGKQSN